MPDWNRADLNGIVAACRTAGAAGAGDVRPVRHRDLPVRAGRAAAAQLRRHEDAAARLVFADGETLSFTDYICDDGVGFGPYKLKLSLTRTGDKVVLDFTGSVPQAQGPINYYINENLVRMFFGIYMITVADPQILWNDGFYPLVDVTIPEGSFWKPKYPAALNAPQPRHRPGLRPVRRAARPEEPGAAQRGRLLLLAALHVLRELPAATARASGSSCTRSASAASRAGRSATGRTGTRCGRSSSTSRASSSSRTTRCGSSGGRPSPTPAAPGCTAAATASTSPTGSWSRARSPSTTTAGSPTRGASTAASRARAARKWLERADGSREVLPSKCHDVPVEPGDVLHFVTWGGGGWGDPLERDPELVALEVRRGLVTADGARRYGVVRRRRRRGRRRRRPTRCATSSGPAGSASCRSSTWGRRSGGAAGALRGGDRAAGAEAARSGCDAPGPARRRRSAAGSAGARRRRCSLVDLMRAYFTAGGPLDLGSTAAVDVGGRLLAAAREHGVPVIHTAVRYRAGRRRRRACSSARSPRWPLLADEQPGELRELMPQVAPLGDEVVIVKQYASAFFGTSLASTLHAARRRHRRHRRGVHRGCVRATRDDAMQHGFGPIVVRRRGRRPDRRAARGEPARPRRKYADVVDSAEVLD